VSYAPANVHPEVLVCPTLGDVGKPNLVFYGDKLEAPRKHIADGAVALGIIRS
jgi:hypothetical protein